MDAGGNVMVMTGDGQRLALKRELLTMSATVRTMLENVCSGDEELVILPLKEIRSEVLKIVLVWCEHHANERRVLTSDEMEEKRRLDDVSDWDNQFVATLDSTVLLDLFNAANCLDLKNLVELCLKTVGSLTKGKTAEEIRTLFNITNDLTSADLEMIRIENSWIIDPYTESATEIE